jgi:hypothetical protein
LYGDGIQGDAVISGTEVSNIIGKRQRVYGGDFHHPYEEY